MFYCLGILQHERIKYCTCTCTVCFIFISPYFPDFSLFFVLIPLCGEKDFRNRTSFHIYFLSSFTLSVSKFCHLATLLRVKSRRLVEFLRQTSDAGVLVCRYQIFMKLFQTSNMEVIRHAQCMFNFTLPSLLIKKRSSKFYTGT